MSSHYHKVTIPQVSIFQLLGTRAILLIQDGLEGGWIRCLGPNPIIPRSIIKARERRTQKQKLTNSLQTSCPQIHRSKDI